MIKKIFAFSLFILPLILTACASAAATPDHRLAPGTDVV